MGGLLSSCPNPNYLGGDIFRSWGRTGPRHWFFFKLLTTWPSYIMNLLSLRLVGAVETRRNVKKLVLIMVYPMLSLFYHYLASLDLLSCRQVDSLSTLTSQVIYSDLSISCPVHFEKSSSDQTHSSFIHRGLYNKDSITNHETVITLGCASYLPFVQLSHI